MGLVTKLKASVDQPNTLITIEDITGVYNSGTNPNGYGSPNRGNVNDIVDIIITTPKGDKYTFRNNGVLTDPNAAAVPVLMPANTLTKTFTPAQLAFTNDVLEVGVYKVEYFTWYRISGVGQINDSGRKQVNLIGGNFTSETAGFGTSAVWIKLIDLTHGTHEYKMVEQVVSDSVVLAESPFSLDYFPATANVSIYAGYLATAYFKADALLQACYQPKIAALSIEPKPCCNTCGYNTTDTLMDIMMGLEIVDIQMEKELYSKANEGLQTLYKICTGESCKC